MMQEAAGRREPTDVTGVWGVPLAAVHCARCGEAHLVPEDAIPSRCPYCLQGPVVPQPAYLREEPPEQVLPYGVSGQRLAGILERWTEGIPFRPDELRGGLLARRARRYLLPLWLVDSHVEGAWRADVGFDYQVVSSQEQYRDGMGWSSRQVKETRVRWEPRAGRIDRTYENVAAPALDDHRKLMRRLGKYDLSRREGYRAEAVGDGVVRVPSMEPEAAWPGAEAAIVRATEADCQQASGADHIRDFAVRAEYKDLNWTQLLLPAYVTWYQQGGEVWPVLVNGQSGRVSGVKRASTRRARNVALILAGVGAALFLIGGIIALLGMLLPPVSVIGILILVIGVLVALAAPVPAITAWAFNRRSAGG
jgi:hypothetical protein